MNKSLKILNRYKKMIMRKLGYFEGNPIIYDYSLSQVKVEGLYLEFGVYKARSINYIALKKQDKIVYGFDSFDGLPEDYIPKKYPKGFFKLEKLPKVRKNVKLIVGLFQSTLESFLNKHKEKIAFLNLDADLYSSTYYVLETLIKNGRFQEGTVIQCDELFLWEKENWYVGELKAINDIFKKYNIQYNYIAVSGRRASLILTKVNYISSMESKALDIIKDYPIFNELPASVSGKYHIGETLKEHSENVVGIIKLLCKEFKLSEEERDMLIACGLLHDIGKCIITKKGKIKEDGWVYYDATGFSRFEYSMDIHSILSAEVIDNYKIDNKELIKRIVSIHMAYWYKDTPKPDLNSIYEMIMCSADYLASCKILLKEIINR